MMALLEDVPSQTDGDVVVEEGEGIGVVCAHGIHNAHYSVAGDDARFFLYAVLKTLVQDEVVVLSVLADSHNLGGHYGETLDLFRRKTLQTGGTELFPGLEEFLREGKILPGQVFVFCLEGKIPADGGGSSPNLGHHDVGVFGSPGALQRSVV